MEDLNYNLCFYKILDLKDLKLKNNNNIMIIIVLYVIVWCFYKLDMWFVNISCGKYKL